MKRQLMLSLTLSLLTSTAFALPAAEQATPQVKESHSVFSHTVAADGSDRTPGQTLAEGGNDRLKDKGLIVEDGYDQTPQGQSVAADGSDRTPGQTLAEGGNDRLKDKGLIVEDGYDQTPQGQSVAADGSDRTPGQTLAEGGGDRVIERNSSMS